MPGIELEVGEAQDRVVGAWRRTTQLGANAGEKLGEVERLGDVIVGAEIEAPDAVLEVAPRGAA